MKGRTRHVVANIIRSVGVAGGAYVGGWLMFLSPIIEFCKAYDAGAITGLLILFTFLKCFFAGSVAVSIIYLACIIALLIEERKGK